ncbi:MAG: fibrillarin-like rRNA/tRNA 2'-O-methyltransferase [Halodesulfurarchaeum sp.]
MTLPDGVERRQFDGERLLATKGEQVYGEPTTSSWRRWDPSRSKLGAMFEMGLETGIEESDTVLYLGAANGTTVSHVADFAGPTYAVEMAPRPTRDLIDVAESRENVIPLLADARKPRTYAHVVEANVDAVVQDVATRNQAAVAARNAMFLHTEGRFIGAIKARSEDVTRDPDSVFDDVLDSLKDTYDVLETVRLDQYHLDHLAVIAEPNDGGPPASGSI